MAVGLLESPLLDRIRIRMAGAVVSRLGSDDQRAAFGSLRDNESEPWYPRDSPVRRVHGDVAMLIGGIRALLMQSLHPVAMQAVEEHSGYHSDPWGRLRRTAAFVAITTFGSRDQALGAINRVRAVHDQVSGHTPAGFPYHASDPELLRWVHVAEADSFLTAYRLYGRTSLAPADADRYVDDLGRVARALGSATPPHTVDQLHAQLDAFRPELRGGGQARAATRLLLWHPPLTGAARAGYRLLAAGAVASLPPWAHGELGLVSLPIMDRAMLRPAARSLLIMLDRGLEASFDNRPDTA